MKKLIVQNSPVDSLSLKATMGLDTLRILNDKDMQYLVVSGCTSMRYLRAVGLPVLSLNLSNLPALEYVNLISLGRMNSLKTDNDASLQHLMTYGLVSLKTVNVLTNPALHRLFLESCTAVTAIDVTNNPQLTMLVATYCGSLKNVDLSKNPNLIHVMFGDCGVDSIDVSHNPQLNSLNMVRTPLRNLSLLANPKLTYLALQGCASLKTVDLRAQKAFDYYAFDGSKYGTMPDDDLYQLIQNGLVLSVQDALHPNHIMPSRKGVNGATADIFAGLNLPQYLDANALNLTNVKVNDAVKDNYSLVMAKRVLPGMTPALITVYAADQTTVLCNDYDPNLFKCN
jgi:hypothetical protein